MILRESIAVDVAPSAPSQVQAMARDFARRCALSDAEGPRLAIILEELVTNVVKHGGSGGATSAVLRLAREHDRLVIEFEDDGPAFDPTAYRAPGLDEPLESRPDGRLGLHIVQELAHELSYRREGGRNMLRIVRRIREP
jgi:anti-sigma regulatory factor (Ser/Thr protein kinase)